MTVEDIIYQQEGAQQELMLYLHKLLLDEFNLTAKITFGNPCYYLNSWICYLKPTKKGKVEFAFMRGNELSNQQGILKSNGRKQLRSVEFETIKEIPLQELTQIMQEAILLDETIPYESIRNKK